ncbi:putative membrane protein [Altererythrobacter atlanticus]|uniref:Uncharacterized protein n=1 Tax=Croceibacterium atlanticum TaxID=1267766 RepID=A0A0F7KXT2_9SPHN|nr:anthrone oxygenase family protein [Croceibacterium atlanticum]AKH44051.1 hypothetical protein WYH_03031 [Croceibacterium atlanticum]MBB5732358.1 putative membrane protein [Croceibacterium atlanticum]
MQIVLGAILWFAVLAVGIMAGVYFTFSTFLMQSLDRLDRPAGMVAMQTINRVILVSPFLPLFFVSSLACAALVVAGVVYWNLPGSWQMAAGGAAYVLGMFVVTATRNVPLNNALEATDPAGPEGEAMWRRYMKRWMAWNHVRSVACVLSLALLVMAVMERG